MKKVILILVASLSVAALFSCQRVKEEVIPEGKPDIHTLSVRFPEMTDQNGTKVSLATTGKTQWEVGDKLVIYGNPSSSDATKRVVHEIVAGDITNPEVAVFDVDFEGLAAQSEEEGKDTYYDYTVAYPYTDGQPYYVSTGTGNYGRSRFQNTNQLLMAGHVSDDKSSIVLYPVTAAITFSVSGDFDSYIFSGKAGTEVVGYSNLVVEGNRRSLGEGKYRQKYKANGGTSGPLTSISGSVNGDGTSVNHIFLPVNAERKSGPSYDLESVRYADVVYLPNGFTIQFLKDGVIKKYISSSAPLIMKPGHMINLGLLPAVSMHDYSLSKEQQRLARLGRTPIVATYFTKNTPSAEFPTLAEVRCFTHINVGPVRFVNKTTGDGGLEIPSPGATYMQQMAAYKQDYPELKLLLFIGGWGANGDGFSEMAKDPDKRALFCSECLRICNEYNFDGVDIDWEYPTYAAKDGEHYNGADPADTGNFTILMRELRRTLGPYRLISYAASDSGQYINNAEVLEWVDYINVMTYSMGDPPKHNSPLYRSSLTRSRSGEESIEIFHGQGVPYNRMNYGLAFYGHADGTIYPSSMPYHKIVDALTTGVVDGKSVAGYNNRCWDDVGKNVYLGDGSGNMYASYEDTESLSYRVAFVKAKAMLGAFSWEYREDDSAGTLRHYVYNAFYPPEP